MHAGEQRMTRHGNMRWWNDVDVDVKDTGNPEQTWKKLTT